MSTTKPPAIHIRALSAADATVMHAWRNDDRITDMLVGPKRFVSLETEVAWNQKAREEHERGTTLRFAICLADTDQLIGVIDLNNVDLVNGTAVTGVMLDPQQQGKGIAKQAYALVLKYAFEEMGLHVLFARILSMNQPSQALYASLGFREDGAQRQAVLRAGKRYDVLIYSLLAEEYLLSRIRS